jgi:hypothetical protein
MQTYFKKYIQIMQKRTKKGIKILWLQSQPLVVVFQPWLHIRFVVCQEFKKIMLIEQRL